MNATFTWIGRLNKRSRIDRAVINSAFAGVCRWIISATARKNSDHRGLVLYKEDTNWGPKPYRFFNVWLKDKTLMDKIKDSSEKSKCCKLDLKDLQREVKGIAKEGNSEFNVNIYSKFKDTEEELAKEEERVNESSIITALKQRLEDMYLIRDCMVRQKARITWLKARDRNTKFFHQALQGRRAKNSINKLLWNGRMVVSPSEIKKAATCHFQNLFSCKFNHITFKNRSLISRKLTDEESTH